MEMFVVDHAGQAVSVQQDAFWSPRLKTLRERTVPYCLKMCDETGRIGNFEKAAGTKEGKFEGYFFNDSDVYKVLEGAAYTLMLEPDSKLESAINEIVAKIAARRCRRIT